MSSVHHRGGGVLKALEYDSDSSVSTEYNSGAEERTRAVASNSIRPRDEEEVEPSQPMAEREVIREPLQEIAQPEVAPAAPPPLPPMSLKLRIQIAWIRARMEFENAKMGVLSPRTIQAGRAFLYLLFASGNFQAPTSLPGGAFTSYYCSLALTMGEKKLHYVQDDHSATDEAIYHALLTLAMQLPEWLSPATNTFIWTALCTPTIKNKIIRSPQYKNLIKSFNKEMKNFLWKISKQFIRQGVEGYASDSQFGLLYDMVWNRVPLSVTLTRLESGVKKYLKNLQAQQKRGIELASEGISEGTKLLEEIQTIYRAAGAEADEGPLKSKLYRLFVIYDRMANLDVKQLIGNPFQTAASGKTSLANLDEIPGTSTIARIAQEITLLDTVPIIRHAQWCVHEKSSMVEIGLGLITGIGAAYTGHRLSLGLCMLALRGCIPYSVHDKHLIMKYPQVHKKFVQIRDLAQGAIEMGRDELRAHGWKEGDIDRLGRSAIQAIAGALLFFSNDRRSPFGTAFAMRGLSLALGRSLEEAGLATSHEARVSHRGLFESLPFQLAIGTTMGVIDITFGIKELTSALNLVTTIAASPYVIDSLISSGVGQQVIWAMEQSLPAINSLKLGGKIAKEWSRFQRNFLPKSLVRAGSWLPAMVKGLTGVVALHEVHKVGTKLQIVTNTKRALKVAGSAYAMAYVFNIFIQYINPIPVAAVMNAKNIKKEPVATITSLTIGFVAHRAIENNYVTAGAIRATHATLTSPFCKRQGRKTRDTCRRITAAPVRVAKAAVQATRAAAGAVTEFLGGIWGMWAINP